MKPALPHFFVWLQKLQNKEPVTLGAAHVPAPFSRDAVLETGLFHLLIGLKGLKDSEWDWNKQMEHLNAIEKKIASSPKFQLSSDGTVLDVKHALSKEYNTDKMSERQTTVIAKATKILTSAEPKIADDPLLTLISWLRCLFASSVTEAYLHIRQLDQISPCIVSDLLLRTPMSRKELHHQLTLWDNTMAAVGRHYHHKPSHLMTIISNLSYYCVHYDHSCLLRFLQKSLGYFSSKRSGFQYRLLEPRQVNKLLWTLTTILIQTLPSSEQTAMSVIRSQELLVKHLGHLQLSQLGYMAIVISLLQVDKEKAQKLYDHAKNLFPEPSVEVHVANIYLSKTTEQILHNFNVSMSQYDTSATLWLAFLSKLQELGLLTEQRSSKLLAHLLERADKLIISKQILLLLLQPVKTVHEMEQFIAKLQQANMLKLYWSIIHNKYLQLLYQNSDGLSLRTPYLDTICKSSSNLECARELYKSIERKTVTNVGVMLAGESVYQAENLYGLYQKELGTRLPDENCLIALIKAASQKRQEKRIWWNNLHASQIAVYEFKLNVSLTYDDTKVMPSDWAWQLYIGLLKDCDYTSELSEILRWWEQLHFVPARETLLALLKALPVPFAQRHIRHWRSVPDSASSLKEWPWPAEEDLRDK